MSMSRTRVAVAAAVLIAASVTSCSRVVPGQPNRSSSPTPAASAPAAPAPSLPPAPPSDEDQVRAAVMVFQDAYNTQKWDTYRESMCTAMRNGFTDPMMEQVKKTRADQGLTNVTVTDVDVRGDTAVATLDAQNEMLGRRTIQIDVLREDGWKVCTPNGVR